MVVACRAGELVGDADRYLPCICTRTDAVSVLEGGHARPTRAGWQADAHAG
jgi:hypothetical protein